MSLETGVTCGACPRVSPLGARPNASVTAVGSAPSGDAPLAATRDPVFELHVLTRLFRNPFRGWPLTGPPRFSSMPVPRQSAFRASSEAGLSTARTRASDFETPQSVLCLDAQLLHDFVRAAFP